MASSKKRSYRQASEDASGHVSVLCYACRRATDSSTQHTLTSFFASGRDDGGAGGNGGAGGDGGGSSNGGSNSSSGSGAPLCCSKCRRLMAQSHSAKPGVKTSSASSRVLPQIARIRAYQRLASEQSVPFDIAEHEAAAMMRQPCTMCGEAAPTEGHGLTRMRIWPEHLTRPERGGFMGPFARDNLAPACGVCNLMKGYRKVRGFVEACRHIATVRGRAGDFGRYPQRFRNNTSRRSRSAYITASSTHTKTHALSNEAFGQIVAMPCHYCGKESDPDGTKTGEVHHNGLDRLDSSCRVYTVESCVSCCGDCNVMKYTHSEAFFLSHCLKVARHNQGTNAFVGDAQEGDDEEDPGRAPLIETAPAGPLPVDGDGDTAGTGVHEQAKIDEAQIVPWDEWGEPEEAELEEDIDTEYTQQ